VVWQRHHSSETLQQEQHSRQLQLADSATADEPPAAMRQLRQRRCVLVFGAAHWLRQRLSLPDFALLTRLWMQQATSPVELRRRGFGL
jgi:hypothetical protein